MPNCWPGSIAPPTHSTLPAVSIGGATSLILPNVAENHYALWGGQALGVAGPINYLLEPVALRGIMKESETQALAVLGPAPGFDIWEKAISIVDEVPTPQMSSCRSIP